MKPSLDSKKTLQQLQAGQMDMRNLRIRSQPSQKANPYSQEVGITCGELRPCLVLFHVSPPVELDCIRNVVENENLGHSLQTSLCTHTVSGWHR